MRRVRLPFIIAALCLLACAAGVNAALVRTDSIGGLGEFEFSAETPWQMATDSGWPTGIAPATPGDTVAVGWSRLTGYGVVPRQDTIYDIAPNKGLNGSNCQYLAVRGSGSRARSTYLTCPLTIRDDVPFELHHGDRITFRLDHVFMSDYDLPSGVTVQYALRMSYWVPGKTGSVTRIELPASATPFSVEVSSTVVPEAYDVSLQVEVTVAGNSGSIAPGIYVDGARLFLKRSGSNSYQMEEVPVPRNRAVQTQMVLYKRFENDPYATARDYDAVAMRQEAEYPQALRLRYYNPDIQVFLYESGGCISDWRDQSLADPPYSNCPLQFSTVLAEHINWLYPWPVGFTPVVDQRQPWLRDTQCVFSTDYPFLYYARVADPGYQASWRESTADKATRYRMDGVFVDTLEAVQTKADEPVTRTPVEVQSFVHAVFPYLRQSGLQVLMNCSVGILNEPPTSIYFDPKWKTSSAFPVSQGYENNSPEKTADTFFQEWAFLKHWSVNGVDGNRYDLGYWNGTLSSMELVASWNKTIPKNLRKTMFAYLTGVDRPEDPAAGLDGWIHFGFCSFLLTQHRYAWFGGRVVSQPQIDLSNEFTRTVRLGDPISGRAVLASDKSLQMRIYRNGLVMVNGHPTLSRTYRMVIPTIGEDGVRYPLAKMITLRPHTGRIFYFK